MNPTPIYGTNDIGNKTNSSNFHKLENKGG